MKKSAGLLLSAILVSTCCLGQEVDASQLVNKAGLFYEKNKAVPFSGHALTYFDNKAKHTSTEYKSGKIEGKIESWYLGGVKQVEGEILQAQKSGIWTAWYENGNKLRQGGYVVGKEEGEFTWWTEKGTLNKKGIYHAGIADGIWVWFYENGKKKQEGILKGEINEGIWKEWHENGNQKMTGGFINGLQEGEWTWWDENGNVTTKKKYKAGQLMNGPGELDGYIEKMEYAVNEKDFKSALSHIEKAIASIENKSESNKVYMGLIPYHSAVYALFNHLDEAETVLLKATGIPDKDIAAIVNTNYPQATNILNGLIRSIGNYPGIETKIAPHIALAYLYNITGDTIRMQAEQQLMMERSGYSDWVIQVSMSLYKIRGLKENLYGDIHFLKEKIIKEGETRDAELQLANNYIQVGQFTDPGIIADRYLLKDNKDVDFLFAKYNIEMALGNLNQMRIYKNRILAIDSKAFDEKLPEVTSER